MQAGVGLFLLSRALWSSRSVPAPERASYMVVGNSAIALVGFTRNALVCARWAR